MNIEKLYSYLDKIGADYRREKYGANYFLNAPAIECGAAVVRFEFFDRETVTDWHKKARQIERYAARYGFTIFNRGGALGCEWFAVIRSDDLRALDNYNFYVRQSVDACEKLAHDHYIGVAVCDDLNGAMRQIMEKYGAEYCAFLEREKWAIA